MSKLKNKDLKIDIYFCIMKITEKYGRTAVIYACIILNHFQYILELVKPELLFVPWCEHDYSDVSVGEKIVFLLGYFGKSDEIMKVIIPSFKRIWRCIL